MQVVATAGHVDHGKSTLIRALTGTDPDRLAEERRRGLTIDLGFAWTRLPSGREVSFVDVPGHERFLGNMLAGIGPAPIVCFVVAADEGWQAQSADHRDAIAALGIDQGIVVITRSDLAPERVGAVTAQVRAELAGTPLAGAPAVAVSAAEGSGMQELRALLDQAVGDARRPEPEQRVRLWIDRSFTIDGAGTVVTGTLGAGTVHREDRLELCGSRHGGEVVVRGLQSRGGPVTGIGPVSRAAVNLRGIDREGIGRGDALLTPGAWELSAVLDVRRTTGRGLAGGPEQLVVHIGTAAVTTKVRPFGDDHARLTLARPLPLTVGDRMVLRGSDSRAVHAGVHVLDVDPPRLSRRGDGTRRRAALEAAPLQGDAVAETIRRGAVRERMLRRLGLSVPAAPPGAIRRHGEWWVDRGTLRAWSERLRAEVEADRRAHPLSAGLPRKAAVNALGLPEASLLDLVLESAGMEQRSGRIHDPAVEIGLGSADAAVAEVEQRLSAAPFHAPEAHELRELGLGARELAAAAREGRLLRLTGEVVLLPTGPALAMRELARLPQPFSASQARRALGTTRRVVIPLLEHLDARGWTRRLDSAQREVVR